MWKRYRFRTKSTDDCRPLVFNPKYPWWLSGYDGSFTNDYAVIIAYLPIDEDLFKYWDDAYDIDSTTEDKIVFTDRFPRPDYLED